MTIHRSQSATLYLVRQMLTLFMRGRAHLAITSLFRGAVTPLVSCEALMAVHPGRLLDSEILRGKRSWSVAVTGNDPNSEIVLVATGDGLYRSTDSGANFIKVEEGSPPGPTNSAEPVLPDGAATDVIVANGGIIYAAIAGEGIFRSTNDGVA